MKIILDGHEVRSLFESYSYYIDADNPVDFMDIVATINDKNSHFKELIYYICSAYISWQSLIPRKINPSRLTNQILDQIAFDFSVDPFIDLLDIEIVPSSGDIILTIATGLGVTVIETEVPDKGAEIVELDINGDVLTPAIA